MDFRRFIFQEMPLSAYKWQFQIPHDAAYPDSDEAIGHFHLKDRQRIQNKKLQAKLEQVLNRTPFKWNILLLELDDLAGDTKRTAYKYATDNNIDLNGHITFAANSSTGDPMTPWMILHKIGHAINAQIEIKNILSPFIRKYQGSTEYSSLQFMAGFLPFRSAKGVFKNQKSRIANEAELSHELVAYYLWNGGRMPLKANPNIQAGHDYYRNKPFLPWQAWMDKRTEVTQEELNNLSHQLESVITTILNHQVGTIIVDDYQAAEGI